MMNEQKAMLMKIQQVCFSLEEIKLFLDTHPTDKGALDTFGKYQKIYKELVSEYEGKYGPLTANSTDTSKGWTWIDNPWPWEMEANS